MTSSPDSFVAWSPPDHGADASKRFVAPLAIVSSRSLDLPDLASNGPRTAGPNTEREWTEAEVAYQRGVADGIAQTETAAREAVAPAVEALQRAVDYLRTADTDFTRDREKNLQVLALAVAHKLVQREIQADPELLRDLIGRALELLPHDPVLDLRLNPEDVRVLQPDLDRITSANSNVMVQCVPDPTLERGNFLVESPYRILDGRIDASLRALYERFEHD